MFLWVVGERPKIVNVFQLHMFLFWFSLGHNDWDLCYTWGGAAVSFVLLRLWVSPHLSFNAFLHRHPSSSWKVPLFSLSHPPTFHPTPFFLQPSVSPLCCWCIIMSEDEGMVCLCAPEGLPTHWLKERDSQRRQRHEYNPALLFSSALFSPTTSVVHGLCGTALFLSLTRQQKHTKTLGRNKDQRGRTVCNSMFRFLFPLSHMACLDEPIVHTHMQLQ